MPVGRLIWLTCFLRTCARSGLATRVEIDGGVNLQTVSRAVAAGADTLVTASALFGARDRKAVVDAMHNA
ncbi:MAG: hypothetical protein IT440_00990 [Phycisphaeraceae bacterium]|nr:hypothetical protein [Phycisphaeraceae bacterium]